MSDWGDKTVEGAMYSMKNNPNRDKDHWKPCGIKKEWKDADGKHLAYDRFNKCFRPVKDGQWDGSPDDVTPIGNKPSDSEVANAYIKMLKQKKTLLDLIEELGFHHAFVSNLRVQLTRVGQRLNAIGRDKLGAAEYDRRKNLKDDKDPEKIFGLTGLRIPSEWAIKAVKKQKEPNEAFSDALTFLGL